MEIKLSFLNLSGIVFNTGPGRTNVINFEVWGINKITLFLLHHVMRFTNSAREGILDGL